MANKAEDPKVLDLANLGEGIENNPAEAAATVAEPDNSGEKEGYSPRPAVIDKLNTFPKEEIRSKFGIDLDYLIMNEKRYGVLEALAYGDFTRYPIKFSIHIPNSAKRIEGPGTVQLKCYRTKAGEQKLTIDFHQVALTYKTDKDGRMILDANGRAQQTYDCNPLREDSIVKFDGKELNEEERAHLRLTGNLGAPKTISYFYDGKMNMKTVLVSVDPYNNHELIVADVEKVSENLMRDPTFRTKIDGETVEMKIGQQKLGELALGKGVWLGDQKKGLVYVQYNTATRRLERATLFDKAYREEISAREAASQKQAKAQEEANGIKVGAKI